MTPGMTEPKRIAILTGGGDVPGLNAVIKSVVYRATEAGYTALGIRRGWEGLTHLRPGAEPDPTYLRPLDRTNTRTIERTGGHHPPHVADEPAQDARRRPAAVDERGRTRAVRRRRRPVRPDAAGPRQPRPTSGSTSW